MKRFLHILCVVALLAVMPTVSAAGVHPEVAEATVEVRSAAVEVTNSGSEAMEVAIYAVTGRLVRQATVGAGAAELFELPAGYYIVKAGSAPAVRVLVK